MFLNARQCKSFLVAALTFGLGRSRQIRRHGLLGVSLGDGSAGRLRDSRGRQRHSLRKRSMLILRADLR